MEFQWLQSSCNQESISLSISTPAAQLQASLLPGLPVPVPKDIKKTALKSCLSAALLYKPTQLLMNSCLSIIAQSVGLDFLQDEDNPGVLTICGSVFVIDISTDPLNVNLSSESNKIDPAANIYLTNLLRGYHMDNFERALTMLAFLDKSARKVAGLDLYHCLTGLQADLALILKLES